MCSSTMFKIQDGRSRLKDSIFLYPVTSNIIVSIYIYRPTGTPRDKLTATHFHHLPPPVDDHLPLPGQQLQNDLARTDWRSDGGACRRWAKRVGWRRMSQIGPVRQKKSFDTQI